MLLYIFMIQKMHIKFVCQLSPGNEEALEAYTHNIKNLKLHIFSVTLVASITTM